MISICAGGASRATSIGEKSAATGRLRMMSSGRRRADLGVGWLSWRGVHPLREFGVSTTVSCPRPVVRGDSLVC